MAYIDMFDSADSLNVEAMEKVDRYYKVQYRTAAVQRLPEPLARKVRPTGFHFPIRAQASTPLLISGLRAARAALLSSRRPTARRLYDSLRYAFQSQRRVRNDLPTYEEYTRFLADEPTRESDLFWNVSWWPPRLDPEGASASRLAVMRVLDEVARDRRYRLRYGFIDSPDARIHVSAHVLIPTPATKDYLRLVARSKMSIVPLGVQRCFSHRVGEHLALRRFALMERFANEAAVPLVDGVNAVFYESDLSDLESKLRYYLSHESERERIATEGRKYFDEHCAPDRQVTRMIDETLAS